MPQAVPNDNNKKAVNNKIIKEEHYGNNNPAARDIYLAIELSNRKWKLFFSNGEKIRSKSISSRDLDGLSQEIEAAKKRFKLNEDVSVISCQTILPFIFGHFLVTLAGHFCGLGFVLIVKL